MMSFAAMEDDYYSQRHEWSRYHDEDERRRRDEYEDWLADEERDMELFGSWDY